METQQQSTAAEERGAWIIKRAVELLQAGQARGWSDAIAKARTEAQP